MDLATALSVALVFGVFYFFGQGNVPLGWAADGLDADMTEKIGDTLATDLGPTTVIVAQDEDFLAIPNAFTVIAMGVGGPIGLGNGLPGTQRTRFSPDSCI